MARLRWSAAPPRWPRSPAFRPAYGLALLPPQTPGPSSCAGPARSRASQSAPNSPAPLEPAVRLTISLAARVKSVVAARDRRSCAALKDFSRSCGGCQTGLRCTGASGNQRWARPQGQGPRHTPGHRPWSRTPPAGAAESRRWSPRRPWRQVAPIRPNSNQISSKRIHSSMRRRVQSVGGCRSMLLGHRHDPCRGIPPITQGGSPMQARPLLFSRHSTNAIFSH